MSSVASEVRAAFERYDVAALNDCFLPGAQTVRYGIAEQNYGSDAISAYRRGSEPIDPNRTLERVVVSVHGEDAASVSAEFIDPATPGIGRQTQTWVRTAQGWKIAVAHVSMNPQRRD